MLKEKKSYFALIIALVLIGTITFAGCGAGNGGGNAGAGDNTSTAGTESTKPSTTANDKTEIVIGYVAPLTGPLANFASSLKWVESQVLPVINKDGGIYIKGYDKKLPLRIVYGDSESDPNKAMEVAENLILNEHVDILVATGTPDTIIPVTSVAQRRGVPALMSDSPVEQWWQDAPYDWVAGNLFSFAKVVPNYVDLWDKVDTNKKVGYILDNETDGMLVSGLANDILPGRGYEIVDPGRFPMGTNDYTSLISQLKNADANIVLANMITPDFAVLWKQMQQNAYIPKVLQVGKALHFYEDIVGLGNADGLATEYHWDGTFPYKSSLLDMTCADIANMWETDNPGVYPPSPIGYDTAVFEVLNDALSRCDTLDPAEIIKQIKATNYDGVLGKLSYDDKGSFIAPCVAAQWVATTDGPWQYEIRVNGSADRPEIPTVPAIPLPNATVK